MANLDVELLSLGVHAHKVSPWRRVLRCRGPGDAGRRLARHWPRRTLGGRRSRADLVQLLAQEGSAGSFASPPRDFQSGPAGAGGGPAHEAIRPRSCAPALPRRCRSIHLSVIAFALARLDEVAAVLHSGIWCDCEGDVTQNSVIWCDCEGDVTQKLNK